MGIASWAVLRQVEALRESVASVLSKGAIPQSDSMRTLAHKNWVSEQGLDPVVLFEGTENELVSVKHSMQQYVESHCSYGESLALESRYSQEWGERDIGVERSGVGWHSLPYFVIGSAFVRLLGASEQFELDALKALLHYRPLGTSPPVSEYIEEKVAADVLTEIPADNAYAKPIIWSWIRKPAENNEERRAIFKKVFGIEASPDGFKGWKSKEINKYRQQLYEKRNAVAHGRARVEMTLLEYCDAEWYVVDLVRSLATQCLARFKLIL